MRRLRAAAYALAVGGDGVLLARISPSNVDAGQWTLPGGGLNHGEAPVAALHRELMEETGLSGSIRSLVGIQSILLPIARSGSLHALRFVYDVDCVGEPVAEIDGSTDLAAWVPLGDLDHIETVELVDWALAKSGHIPPEPTPS